MTIELFIEIPSDEASSDREGRGELTRRFTIKTRQDLAPIRDAQVMLDLALRQRPDLRPFGVHPTRRDAYVTEPRINRQSRWLWDLSVPYSTEVTSVENEAKELSGQKLEPTNRRAKISISTKTERTIIIVDINGKPIANLAGDPFNDQEDDAYLLEISVNKNVAKINEDWLLKYPGSVNEEEMKFLTVPFPAKTLLLTDLSIGDIETESVNGKIVAYYPLSYRLTYSPGGWKRKLLNVGFRERQLVILPVTRERVYRLLPIKDHQGVPIDESVFLDKEGRAYRVGVDPGKVLFSDSDFKQPLRTELTDQERITLEFEIKRVLPFKKLPHK